jgi:hypothetical protein
VKKPSSGKSSRKKSSGSASDISRDALTAWTQLRTIGGIEPGGRDADLEERLRIALKTSSTSLQEALEQSTTDQLVEAFFALLQPYVAMFRAILDFFEEAGAREGREAWRIRIENEQLDLKHFQSFVSSINSIPSDLDVPAIDRHGGWSLHDAQQVVKGLPSLSDFLDPKSHATTGVPDVDEWLTAYKRGQYLSFPASLQPGTFEGSIRDAAAIATASVDIVRRSWRDREEMLDEHRARGHAIDEDDGFSPRTIAQEETDYRLFSMAIQLSAFRSLPEADQKRLAGALEEQFSLYPRRKIGIRASASDLERILELPVWQKRHELYAVWVATEIVNAAPGAGRELHHENGRITFAFKETVVATFRNTYPTARLYAERRSPLADPIGHGRKNNVQPDFGLWRGSGQHEQCGVVVEVKHYKKDAPARFKEVLTDYGRALPKAEIVLVSHGPARRTDYDVPSDVEQRYHIIGRLTANNLEKRRDLAERIRAFLKDSVVLVEGVGAVGAVAIDVSPSMSPVLDEKDFLLLVRSLVPNDSIPLVLIDSEIRCSSRLCDVEDVVRATPRGNTTELTNPLAELLKKQASVLVITDAEGLASIRGMKIKQVSNEAFRSAKVEVALVTSA